MRAICDVCAKVHSFSASVSLQGLPRGRAGVTSGPVWPAPSSILRRRRAGDHVPFSPRPRPSGLPPTPSARPEGGRGVGWCGFVVIVIVVIAGCGSSLEEAAMPN